MVDGRHRPRRPTAADVASLAEVERAADAVLAAALGGVDLGDPTDGAVRAAAPGFLRVVGRPVVGFAHVLDEDGSAHLDQLAVRPEAARRGIGRTLVDDACAEARRRGHATITLTTFRDVAFNGPFYASCGFEVVDTPGPRLARHVDTERWLEAFGPRVAMRRDLDRHGGST